MAFAIQTNYLPTSNSAAVPLFMDVHKGSGFTLEDVKRNHLADLAVQGKYGVRYVQYWVNEEAGRVFCLMEGPDKLACEKVHHEAHGDIACNIIQVEKADYDLLMGVTTVDDFELAHDLNGQIDSGDRVFISISFTGPEKLLVEPEFVTGTILREQQGREIVHPGPEILGVFNSCYQAVQCARKLQSGIEEFLKEQQLTEQIEYRIALAAGGPVTEGSGLFTDTLKLVSRLNSLAGKNQLIVSSLVKHLYQDNTGVDDFDGLFQVLSSTDEKLLTRLMEVAESRPYDAQFDVSKLSKEFEMSSLQFFKRINYLTDRTPNDLINELRLTHAEKLMRLKKESP
jgi:AraC-like DNA-binding protein